jgi:hypothetical protein
VLTGGTGRFHRLYIKEGGSWGKHGFPHGSEPKASDAHDPPPHTAPTWTIARTVCTDGPDRTRTSTRLPLTARTAETLWIEDWSGGAAE